MNLYFLKMFWILVITGIVKGGAINSENSLENKKLITPRGYYGGVGYPFVPFGEPLTILAGLAFLAYIIQAFHVLYNGGNNAGGLLNNVLPSKNK